MKILLTTFKGTRIADMVVVVTDGDKVTAEAGKPLPGISRKNNLETFAVGTEAGEALDVFVNTFSLEPDLVSAGNAELLKTVYLKLHPRSEEKWDTAISKSGDEQARAIQQLFETTRKGDFAHILADKITEGADFSVPDYMQQAIKALVR